MHPEDEYSYDLGVASDDVYLEIKPQELPPETQQSEHDPTFEPREPEAPPRCVTCGNKLTQVNNIDGECHVCALKRMRKIETRLSQLNQIKGTRTYCAIEGHREAQKTPLFPDWDGVIMVNGIKLQPVFPLCRDCINQLTAFLVFYLESRGILRKGGRNIKNEYGDPFGVPLTAAEEHDAVHKLNEFMSVVNMYAMDDKSPMNTIYRHLVERRGTILRSKIKEAKKCLESDKQKARQLQAEKDANLLKAVSAENGKSINQKEMTSLLQVLQSHPLLSDADENQLQNPILRLQLITTLKENPNLTFLQKWSADSVDALLAEVLPHLLALNSMEDLEIDI